MRIAVYSHYFTPEISPAAARIHDMGIEWLREGHAVDVVTCFPNHPQGRVYPGYRRSWYRRENLSGVNVHRHFTYMTRNQGILKRTLGHLSYFASAAMGASKRADSPDVVMGTSPPLFAATAAAWTGRMRGVPFVMEVRDLWPAILVDLGVARNPALIRLLNLWETALYKEATRIVTVTDSFRRMLTERGIPESKVTTISNGADADFWRPVATRDSIRAEMALDKSFVVLYAGTHGISQGLAAILETARLLQDRPEIRFVFVGDGAEKPMLIEKARMLSLANVEFHPPVDRHTMREYYTLSDLCLAPLRAVPLFRAFVPSKIFEIMSMERPVLGLLQGEAAEILRDAQAGVVVPPEDASRAAEAILELSRNPQRCTDMGRRGRELVIQRYSRRSLALKYLRVLEESVRQGR
ncbi:MAG: glycosyltransferase family 4 protein [Thermodesulfobacteriota bacterium]